SAATKITPQISVDCVPKAPPVRWYCVIQGEWSQHFCAVNVSVNLRKYPSPKQLRLGPDDCAILWITTGQTPWLFMYPARCRWKHNTSPINSPKDLFAPTISNPIRAYAWPAPVVVINFLWARMRRPVPIRILIKLI